MTAVETNVAVHLSLEVACSQECATLAFPLWRQLRTGYEECAVMAVPDTVEEWRSTHRTARKRADRAARLGYWFGEIRRERYDDDIHTINTSKAWRQGRPMSPGYQERQHYLPLPGYSCDRHAIRTYGVLTGRTLVGYLWMYRAGNLALVSSILGHGDHLDRDIMYLLFQGVVEKQAGNRGWFVYNRADSGTDGLRYFKSKLGFQPERVIWAP